jgi:hypothetical protein
MSLNKFSDFIQVLYSKRKHYVGGVGRRPHDEGPPALPRAFSSAVFERAQARSYESDAPWRHQVQLASACIDSQMNLRIS